MGSRGCTMLLGRKSVIQGMLVVWVFSLSLPKHVLYGQGWLGIIYRNLTLYCTERLSLSLVIMS
ncbi:hypothetical protein MA16_Dca015752 [Dendrobium catenatum]|uniref:Uncharacterized protein n=1 Tax=Dendrobium catenatum TaxID=906689 RepID=A0A2I0WHT7_9ASPA|nr:hypothetical protein MA16_Dca015752 [Dendrobium catenatum]